MSCNKLVRSVPNNIPRNPPVYSLVSFSIIRVMPLINRRESLTHLAIFIMSLIASFDIISVVLPDPKISFINYCMAAAFIDGQRSVPRNPSDPIVLDKSL